jgi:hypothetical protein
MSYSYTTTETFTRTHARYISSKIGADLRLLMRYYDRPTEAEIDDYMVELTELLAGGYVGSFEAGFRKDGLRVVSLLYEVRADGAISDDQAGGVYARADTSGASWFTFLTYSSEWADLTGTEQARIRDSLPVDRNPGSAPGDGEGYWESDRSYSAGGVGAARRGFRPAG